MTVITRTVVTGLLCSVVSPAFGREPAIDLDATDLSLDLSAPHAQAPLASDGLAGADSTGGGFLRPSGPYIVGYLAFATIDGDFDGNTAILGVAPLDDVTFVPDLDEGVGFGAGLGTRFGDMAFEVTYQRTDHDTDFVGGLPLGDAVYNSVNVDFKYYFLTDGPLQPHALVGLNVPWLDVDSSSVTPGGFVGKSSYTGVGLSVGGGVTFYLSQKVALIGSAGYRWVWYTKVKGADDIRADILPDDLLGDGFFLLAGVSIGF